MRMMDETTEDREPIDLRKVHGFFAVPLGLGAYRGIHWLAQGKYKGDGIDAQATRYAGLDERATGTAVATEGVGGIPDAIGSSLPAAAANDRP